MRVVVLRLGHRPHRDARITTHVALIARAFGAEGIVIADVKDQKIEQSVRKTVERWGGSFWIQSGVPWKEYIREWTGEIIHLTMYGIPIQIAIDRIRKSDKDKLVIVGAEKVPGEVFKISDYNVAVTSQPHSECGSLAVFLDWLFQGREMDLEFEGAKIRVIPQEKGKKMMKLEDER